MQCDFFLGATSLILDGDASILSLQQVCINGEEISGDTKMQVEQDKLTIHNVTEPAEIRITTRFNAKENTELAGLYKSGDNFCTQCEAEGFRRITYFPDRPDVMSTYTTTIHADREKFPVMLSNGNLVSKQKVSSKDSSMHSATWHDPWPKPSYLFALVAGNLTATRDTFCTQSGKNVDLVIWTDPHNAHLTAHAMYSLQRAMKWDEDRFGLEYDLDLFNIVAVDDFNMGAMENKSLNVFNSRLVLASPDTATDLSYEQIESVVGHEYFHNWTGNRITCRDWFQLSLKEGLTVFRDQEFTMDLHSRPVARINDVRNLRSRQFAEDKSGMSHPVRPISYEKIDNFYTATIYEKGAEVIRMYYTLLGKEKFRKAIDLYFERHDGQACTTDDFFAVMSEVSSVPLDGFERWYTQAGTPVLKASSEYLKDTQQLRLSLQQVLPTPPEAHPVEHMGPQFIPVSTGLLDDNGNDLPLTSYSYQEDSGQTITTTVDQGTTTAVLPFKAFSGEFLINNVPQKPAAVSLLRDFSAPVVLHYNQTAEELQHLAKHDSNPFNRYESTQKLARLAISASYYQESNHATTFNEALATTHGNALEREDNSKTVTKLDPAAVAQMLSLPSIEELGPLLIQDITDSPKDPLLDPLLLNGVRTQAIQTTAEAIENDLLQTFNATTEALHQLEYEPHGVQTGLRSLKGQIINRLVALDEHKHANRAHAMFETATNMTERMMALTALSHSTSNYRTDALDQFYQRWRTEQLNVIAWLGVQARSEVVNNVSKVRALLSHESFDMRTPNKVYALIGGFSTSPANFHAADGSGYEFLADSVLAVDQINPQVSARLLGPFTTANNYQPLYRDGMVQQLLRLERASLSGNASEIVGKALRFVQ
ncbi:aminopeptidase N [Sphaeroforma arctica JP610]|uniref:Aminopeptidase N n=1 Tax=Sphaeroforma arctica JP610 TaxID=667725 RepID=A0A0L0G371_9EUKA|nr:aminopeptidase N [Sphaeroforma arctica JP610]KNC83314.1 aminopeptidase N [Sphaeroforma arctica JP610]|eukprot:XP_014157216.1 aminopeptidase N [Sphaeroforma arctica JP610]